MAFRWRALLNRKFHTVKNRYQFFTVRDKLVPIRHIFHTNISHFVKFAHVVKLYVAYMRNLHIDKIHPKSATFCIRFQFFTYMYTPTKRSDAQPLVEREKQFECLPVEISRS